MTFGNINVVITILYIKFKQVVSFNSVQSISSLRILFCLCRHGYLHNLNLRLDDFYMRNLWKSIVGLFPLEISLLL